MRAVLILTLFCAAVSANPQKVVGGSLATVDQYPFVSSLLTSWDLTNFNQACGSTILNTRAILSAASCFDQAPLADRWRVRVGSSFAHSGGTVHSIVRIFNHQLYSPILRGFFDIAIVYTGSEITYSATTQAAFIAGSNYNVPDLTQVWTVGWGRTGLTSPPSEQLQQASINIQPQLSCYLSYALLGQQIHANQICAAVSYFGGRGPCIGDEGGPLIHNGVVVGVYTFSHECASSTQPAVFTRVSAFTYWIQANA